MGDQVFRYAPGCSARIPPSPRKVAILGGKGGGTIAAQIIINIERATGAYALAGYLNDRERVGTPIHGGTVLGPFDEWASLDPETAFVAPLHKVGHIQANSSRVRSLTIPRERWAVVVDPWAVIADGVEVGGGSVVTWFASVQANSSIGAHCALRHGAMVSHDVTIADFVYVGANAVVSGYCRVGEGAHIGAGAVLRDGVSVGAFSVVGMGAIVTKDVPAGNVVVGNPAAPVVEAMHSRRQLEER